MVTVPWKFRSRPQIPPVPGSNLDDNFNALADAINGQIIFTTPEQFGAVGNGTTDDGPAFNAALQYAFSLGAYGVSRVVINCENAVYGIGTPITLNGPTVGTQTYPNISIRGLGAGMGQSLNATIGSNTGTTLLALSATQSVMATPQLSGPNNTEPYWALGIEIVDINIIGLNTASQASWSAGQIASVGLDLSYSIYVRTERVNVQGFGVGLRAYNVAEHHHKELSTQNNYYNWSAGRIDTSGDCEMWFENPFNNNAAYCEAYLSNPRDIFWQGGECITTSAIAILNNQPRIQLIGCASDTCFRMRNVSAENHTNGKALVSLDSASYFKTVSLCDNTFQSFNRQDASGYNPWLAGQPEAFDYIEVCGNSGDHGVFLANASNFTNVIEITAESGSNADAHSMRVVCENNSPDISNFAVSVKRKVATPNRTYMPHDYVNAIFADNRMWPISLHSRFSYGGTVGDVNTDTVFGPNRVAWNSVAGSNFLSIYPYQPLYAQTFVVVLWVDDKAGANPPQLYATNLGAAGSPSCVWNRCVTDTLVTGGSRTLTKYVFVITFIDSVGLNTNGLQWVEFGNFQDSGDNRARRRRNLRAS